MALFNQHDSLKAAVCISSSFFIAEQCLWLEVPPSLSTFSINTQLRVHIWPLHLFLGPIPLSFSLTLLSVSARQSSSKGCLSAVLHVCLLLLYPFICRVPQEFKLHSKEIKKEICKSIFLYNFPLAVFSLLGAEVLLHVHI